VICGGGKCDALNRLSPIDRWESSVGKEQQAVPAGRKSLSSARSITLSRVRNSSVQGHTWRLGLVLHEPEQVDTKSDLPACRSAFAQVCIHPATILGQPAEA